MVVIKDPEIWSRTLDASGIPPMRARNRMDDDFRAAVRAGNLGAVRVAELRTPGGECFRDAAGAREADQDFCQIYLTATGSTRMSQAGHQVDLGAGDLAVVDPVRPLEVVTTRTRYLTVLVPRHLLGIEAAELAALAGTRVRSTSADLLAGLIRTAAGSLSRLGPHEAARCGNAIAELSMAALSGQLPAPDEPLRAQVQAYIAAHLHEPDLGPATVAAAHHISLRRLHQLFRAEPRTVAALIRHGRLERCRRDLSVSALPIAAVAARWGFADPGHFSRLFRATYGCTATEHRRAALIPN